MINAEATILDKGIFYNGGWDSAIVKISYPSKLPNGVSQSHTTHSLSVHDIIVDNSGFVWDVTSVSYAGSDTYNCSLRELTISNPTVSIEPNTLIEKGLVYTPNTKHLLSPYYHDSYISTLAFRAAMSYNMTKIGTPATTGNAEQVMHFEFKNNLACTLSELTLEKSGDILSYTEDGLYVFNNQGFNLVNYSSHLTDPNIYTIEMRVKPEQGHYTAWGTPPIYMKLLDFNSYSVDDGLYLRNGVFCFMFYDCGNDINKTVMLSDDITYYNLKFIKNNQQLIMYLNDIKQFEVTDTDNVTAPKSKLGFFTDDIAYIKEPFFGTINYLRIYNGIKI